MVDSIDQFEHVVDSQPTCVDPKNNLRTRFRWFVSENYSKIVISLFYKGISKEIPYFKQQKRIFWISSNISQSVLVEYYGYDLHDPGTCKVDVGAPLPQFWCQYFKYFPRGVDLDIFFPLNPVLGISAFTI